MKKPTTIFRSIGQLLICLLFSANLSAQLSGAYNIPGNYANISSAISALNSYGVSGPVTINIAAGYTETTAVGGFTLENVMGASPLNTITFQKSGSGANPLITAFAGGVGTSTSNTQDAIWRFEGTDFVIIDGIDLVDPNTSNPATMEYGYLFLKANANDGCQNNTIKNCVITLNRINNDAGAGPVQPGSKGIAMINATSAANTVAVNVISAAGANSNNKFYSNTIQNCNTGITIYGYVAPSPYTFADWNNDIGGSSAGTGNSILDFGGGGTVNPAQGIVCSGQYNFNASFNRINNNTGAGVNHTAILRGIENMTATAANVTLNSNTITLAANVTTANVFVIENFGGASGTTNTVSIQNNVVTNCSFPLITTANMYGLLNQASCGYMIMNGNKYIGNSTTGTSGSTFLLYNSGIASVTNYVSISNNQLACNFTGTVANTGAFYGVYIPGGSTTASLNVSNNDFSGITFNTTASGTCYFINNAYSNGFYSTTYNNNTFSNLSINNSGAQYLIYSPISTQYALSVTNNSIVGSYTRLGGSGSMYCYYNTGSSLGTSTEVISGNNFSNITSTVSGSGTFYGMYSADGSSTPYPKKTIFNNVISNVNYNTTGSVYSMYATYLGDGSGTSGSEVYNNTVTNFTTNASSFYGLYISSSTSPTYKAKIYANEVGNLYNNAAAGIIYGIYLSANTSIGGDLYKNKIYGLNASGATAVSHGLYLAGGANTYIHNNLIGNIFASATSNTAGVNGIYVSGGTSYTLAYNSVNINAASSATVFGSNAVYLNTSPSVTMLNNIFVNNSTPTGTGVTAAFRRSSTTFTTYGSASNNNLFYAGSPSASRVIYYDGTTAQQTLASYKTLAAGKDAISVTENPPFLSITGTTTNFLSINTSSATQIESGGVALASFPTDYAGTVRNAIPDIGAWEGNYLSSGIDLNPPALVSSGFTSSSCNLSSRTLTVSLSDVSGVASGSLAPRVYYADNAGAYSSSQGVLTSGTATAGVWTFSLTYSASLNDVISYYVVAQDVATTPNLMASPSAGFAGSDVNTITTPPTTPGTYTLMNALSGTYSVGASGTYTSLTAASNAYNLGCLSGPVTFVLTDATYPNEVFPITFSNNVNASSTNSLLITPASSVSVTIAGTSTTAPALVKFYNARYITIDGINSGGSSLTFTNISTSTTADIWLASASSLGVKNIGIKNCTIYGTTYTSSSCYAINSSIDGTNPSTTGAMDNDYVLIQGNTILNAYKAIYGMGGSITPNGGSDNWSITGNKIGPASSGTNNISGAGIQLLNTQLSSVSNNTIANVTYSFTYPTGITLGTGVSSTSVTANYISSIKYTGTSGYGGLGIDVYTSDPNSGIKINNNMLWDISGIGSTSFSSGAFAGIAIGRSGTPGNVSVQYNTVVLNQGSTIPGNGTSAVTAALYMGAGSNHIVRNNILYSNVTYTYTGAMTYGLYSAIPSSAYSIIDNNDYYVTGSQGALAYLTSSLATLSNIQSSFGQNLNSLNIQPVFMSTTNMHKDPTATGNYLLDNKGQVISGITTDIDNVTRNTSTPDIGADEFTSTAVCSTANGGTLASSSFTTCSTSTIALATTGVSSGSNTIYAWQVSSTPGGPYTNVSAGTGSNTSVYNTPLMSGGVYYYVLKATCTTNSVSAVSNEATVTVVAAPVPSVSSSPTVVCSAANTATLIATGATTYTWNTGIASNSIVITPTNSANYFVMGSASGCADAISNIVPLLYGVTPTVTASYATPSVCASTQATLNAAGALSYTWNTGATGATVNPTPSVATVYTVTASGANSNGCVSQATVGMGVYPAPLINISGSSGICTGQSIMLTASGANTYSWNTGASTSSITDTPVANTTYTVIGTNALGCSSSTTQLVTVAASLSITITGPSAICNGQAANLNATGGVTYTWSTGAVTSTIAPTPTTATTYSVIGASGTCSNTALKTIAVNSNPTISVSGSSVICSGQSATLTATGGSTYTWSTGALTSTAVVSPTLNSTYTVTGISGAGCSSSATAAVVSNSLPIISIVQSAATVCASSSATFTASGAATYTWVNGGNTSTFAATPTIASVYTVNATNSLGCSSTQTVALGTYSLPVVSVAPSSATVCSSSQANFTASGASSYTWNGTIAGASASFTPSAAAVYSVTGVSSQGCVSTNTVGVTVNALPVVLIVPASATVCSLASVGFTASGAATYTWNNTTSGANYPSSPASNATYTVIGTDLNGCSSGNTVAVTTLSLPVVAVTPSFTNLCVMSTGIFTASGAISYTWSNSTTAATVAITPTTTSQYLVIGTAVNGCTAAGSAVILTNPLPVLAITPASATVCPNVPQSFAVSGAVTYSWSTGITTPTAVITPSASSIYSVWGTDANGCVGTETLVITTNTVPAISVTPPSASVCPNSSAAFSANGALSYTWSTGFTSAGISVTPSVTSVYTVSGENFEGCISSATVNILVWQRPVIQLAASSLTICAQETVSLTASGASSYTWAPFNFVGSTFTNTPISTFAYSVHGVDNNGCSNSGSITVVVDACTGISNIKEVGARINIYPNPSTGSVTADFGFEGSKEISVLNSVGAMIMKFSTEDLHETFDLSDYAKGVYFIHVTANGISANYKIVIQ